VNVHTEDELRRWSKEALIARVLKLQELVTLAIGAELYTYLTEHPFDGGIFVDSRTNEGRDCLPTLERFANAVVRGL